MSGIVNISRCRRLHVVSLAFFSRHSFLDRFWINFGPPYQHRYPWISASKSASTSESPAAYDNVKNDRVASRVWLQSPTHILMRPNEDLPAQMTDLVEAASVDVPEEVDPKDPVLDDMPPEAEAEPKATVPLKIDPAILTRPTGISYTFGAFFNWFMPSCMDLWTSASSVSNPDPAETIIAYGARSYLFLLDVKTAPKNNLENSDYTITYRDLVNVFDHKIAKKYTDVFRATGSYVTATVFEKRREFFGKSSAKSVETLSGPRIFVGNSDGQVALYNLQNRSSILQDLPLATFKRPCCRKVNAPKILAAAWIVYRGPQGSVVYYSFGCHLISWSVDTATVTVVHDGEAACGQAGRLLGQLQISCLASMSAECTAERMEHKLAVGFNGGKLALFGFDPITAIQRSIILLVDNAHNDDICSLAYSSYSVGSIASYRSGLLVSVSRDSVLKVWSLNADATELAEFRISGQFNRSAEGGSGQLGPSEGQSKCNWFAATFLPKNTVSQGPGKGSTSAATTSSYEILITAPTGELVSLTLPEKEVNSKMRIAKANKFSRGGGGSSNWNTSGGEVQTHKSVIFSIALSTKLGLAVTYSLDYKMLLWDLKTRSSKAVFHLFSNGALSVDGCLKDKRIAAAFGNAVYTLDFGTGTNSGTAPLTTRCTMAPKAWRFYQVSWNNLSDSERLGALALGSSTGEVLYYDLNERNYIVKPGSGRGGKGNHGDGSKIYKLVWPVKMPIKGTDQQRTLLLSLHASGSLLLHYIPSKYHPNRPPHPERFMNGQFVFGLPEQGVLRKHTAIAAADRGLCLVIGNDDGTVEVLKSLEEGEVAGSQLYRHLYRFRAFTKPILSVEVTPNGDGGLWLATTAMHDNAVLCFRLSTDAGAEEIIDETESDQKSPTEIIVRQPTQRYKLVGHSDRVAASAWSPFTSSADDDEQEVRHLVTASYDTTCIIWNVPSCQPVKRFYGHRSLIYCIAWSHFDERIIFSGGEDCFHVWDWTEQPAFEAEVGPLLGKSNVIAMSLKKGGGASKDEVISSKDTAEALKIKMESSAGGSETSATTTTSVSISTTSVSVKALFSLSNGVENNSSKYENLDDIKWIIALRRWSSSSESQPQLEETIPLKKLNRILIYGCRPEEAQRFLALEAENHGKNGQKDAAVLVSMMADFRAAVEKAVEDGEADLILATYAIAFGRDLYKKCIESHWKKMTSSSSSTSGKGNHLSLGRTQRLLAAYPTVMQALSRMYCCSDFTGAIEGLLEVGSYREALILARINLASEELLQDLWNHWYKVRLGQGNNEGAAKCLVAAGRYLETIQLLEQRRLLCAELSSDAVLKMYDEVIGLLKAVEAEGAC